MRVAVLGAGAMGSIFGAALARAGAEIVFYDRRADVVDAIRRDGLRLSGVLGNSTLRAPATAEAGELGQADVALVLVDSTATAEVAAVAEACLSPGGFALTLQNGIGNLEALSEVLGRERVLAGSTYNRGAGTGPGRAAHTNLGLTVIGELDGSISERALGIAAMFEAAGLPLEVVDNVEGQVWSKFVHNCAINPVSALTGLRAGEIARTGPAAALLDRVLDEVLAVVAAAALCCRRTIPAAISTTIAGSATTGRPCCSTSRAGGGPRSTRSTARWSQGRGSSGSPVPVNETIVQAVKAREAAGRRDGRALDEAALEAAARADPRGGRWG